jgi:hypothetical protein
MIRNALMKLDLTAAPIINRYKGESAYESICGGVASVITITVFAVIFIIAIISLLQLNNIKYNSMLISDEDPTSSVKEFYFMFGLTGLPAYDLQQIFQFSLIKYFIDKNHTPFFNPLISPIPLSRCN